MEGQQAIMQKMNWTVEDDMSVKDTQPSQKPLTKS